MPNPKPRYLKQPWLGDPKDIAPAGDPETVVFLPGARGSLVGLRVVGIVGQHVMLGIREDSKGQPTHCAITNELHIDTHADQQSNPRRAQADGDDGA